MDEPHCRIVEITIYTKHAASGDVGSLCLLNMLVCSLAGVTALTTTTP